jgi:hypothetical protein
MAAEFLNGITKNRIIDGLMLGDKKSIVTIIDEVDRLEKIIRDYESGMMQVVQTLNSDTFKKPAV